MEGKINDAIRTYFKTKSYADVLKINYEFDKINDEFEPSRCYVKIQITLDYYINDDNFQVVDINFKNKTCNGFLNLDKAGINID